MKNYTFFDLMHILSTFVFLTNIYIHTWLPDSDKLSIRYFL